MQRTATAVGIVMFAMLSSFLPMSQSSHAATLQGKSFHCANDDLEGWGFNDAQFRILGRFTSNTTLQGDLAITVPRRELCNLGTVSFGAAFNPSTGKWEGSNVSFNLTSDGYLTNFEFTQSQGSFGACRITMDRLRISGDAQPWLHLLLQ